MTLEEFKVHALNTLKANPGMTRMEWFNACCPAPLHRNTMWHTFKFQVAMVLILGGKVKAEDNPVDAGLAKFFPVGN